MLSLLAISTTTTNTIRTLYHYVCSLLLRVALSTTCSSVLYYMTYYITSLLLT